MKKLKTTDLKIITVVNNFDCYNKTIKKNKNMNKYSLTVFDNTKENIGIPKRYNSYIRNNIFSNKVKDSWLVFCHQDFAFIENILPKLEKQRKNCIYGVVGASFRWKISIEMKYLKNFFLRKNKKIRGFLNQGFGFNQYILPNKKFFRNNQSVHVRGVGRFNLINDEIFIELGKRFKKPIEVSTIDCCCLIVHSSLVKKYNLLFDENLQWDCYAEEFCLNANFRYGIKTNVICLDSYHLSLGNIETEGFKKSFKYLKNKYKGKNFTGVCFK